MCRLMQARQYITAKPALFGPLFVFLLVCPTIAADKVAAILLVKDSLAAPNQPVTVEAKLMAKGLLKNSALGGEPIELVINGTVAATAMTGGGGRGLFSVGSKGQNNNSRCSGERKKPGAGPLR